ncbi:NADH-ubiquinone/plastoquinone (complex I) protein [Medicago truncatula]|uniref:NADH-ubiquinone/plastoquinone (Complex I) protein n=1 Tax=Medicago truncatula TaxID=3880 RepID=G7J3M4_MEDTR|nr:NADH-ubiquinone/plastoquinone (complex I) protein [Medicago truncatula]
MIRFEPRYLHLRVRVYNGGFFKTKLFIWKFFLKGSNSKRFGVLHEMGAYGLVLINMELFFHAHSIFFPWLMILGSIQIIYADSTYFVQRIGSISDIGLNGAILQIISHGFICTTLFFFAGTSYDKLRLLYLEEIGGMVILMPKIFTIFTILSMTSLALSGMSGFVAELIVFFWNNY